MEQSLKDAHAQYMRAYRAGKAMRAADNRKSLIELAYAAKNGSAKGKHNIVAEATDRIIQILQDPKVNL